MKDLVVYNPLDCVYSDYNICEVDNEPIFFCEKIQVMNGFVTFINCKQICTEVLEEKEIPMIYVYRNWSDCMYHSKFFNDNKAMYNARCLYSHKTLTSIIKPIKHVKSIKSYSSTEITKEDYTWIFSLEDEKAKLNNVIIEVNKRTSIYNEKLLNNAKDDLLNSKYNYYLNEYNKKDFFEKLFTTKPTKESIKFTDSELKKLYNDIDEYKLSHT